jgi:hypothetical protein
MSTVGKVKGLNCKNCGAAMQLRGFSYSLTVVCPQCLSILDAEDPNFKVLQRFRQKERRTLKLPLGRRGKWKGITYEIIGFQERTITVEGVKYSWDEYLLFNPYQGFRYLTEYQGHWNDVRTVRALPERVLGTKPTVRVDGKRFRHFQKATAETTYVMGEFPWRVERGERITVNDYIAPPLILSSEGTDDEQVWSAGEYTDGREIWKAFELPGHPPHRSGVFANQPNPHLRGSSGLVQIFVLMTLLLIAGLLSAYLLQENKLVYRSNFLYQPGQSPTAIATPVFELEGRPSSVELEIRTDLSNNWAYFSFAFINDDTGEALDFGREISYYSGRDSDGTWTEGSRNDSVVLSGVKAGRYYLRIEPEAGSNSKAVTYSLDVHRDVTRPLFFFLAWLLLAIPPIVALVRRFTFEHTRWQESDYASYGD